MTGVISSLSSFRIIGVIPSGPAASSALRFESTFQDNVDFRHFRVDALESFMYTDRKIVFKFIYA